jgi:hypothetical protein
LASSETARTHLPSVESPIPKSDTQPDAVSGHW